MFQKIAKHRANDASNDVHRPPLSVIEHDRAEDGGRGSSFPNSQCGIFQDMFSTTPPIFSLPPAPGFVRRDSAGTATNNGKEGAIRMSSVLEHDRAQDGGRGSSFPNSHCGMSQDMPQFFRALGVSLKLSGGLSRKNSSSTQVMCFTMSPTGPCNDPRDRCLKDKA